MSHMPAYQTCSPHTGIETRLLAPSSPDSMAFSAYQTCSPHTGIETPSGQGLPSSCWELTKHVPRTRGLKPLVSSSLVSNISFPYQTCSPHTGIETRTRWPCPTRACPGLPYQTCSPHTGIETAARSPEPHGGRDPTSLTKHVPRTRGLKLHYNGCGGRTSCQDLPNMFPAHGD